MPTTTVLTATDIPTDALAAWLADQSWSDFAQSLAAFFGKNGYLTERQEVSARAMYAKVAARQSATTVAPKAVEVASGHYALLAEGVVKFYRVNAVTKGRWAGYTFVEAQASDDYYKVGRDASGKILAEIAADSQGAMKLYGLSLGRCGHCNRTLTDETSRTNGIGPVCARKMGW